MDAKPLVIIGGSASDDDGFEVIWDATRLRDGRIVVGDRGNSPTRVFSATGAALGEFARKGSGPGEIRYPMSIMRCADSLYILDGDEGYRVSVFAPNGRFVRSFRFGMPTGQQSPYATACNKSQFVHLGWEDIRQAKAGTFRTPAPVWQTGANDSITRVIGNFPASERFGLVIDGVLRGTRPLPFGRETRIAMGRDRIYVGTANDSRIEQFDFNGRNIGSLNTDLKPVRLSTADVNGEKEREMVTGSRRSTERDYKEIAIPAFAPPYSRIMVDSEDLLWVQEYPRASAPMTEWHIFSRTGAKVGKALLPSQFEPYDIDRNSIMGRYIDVKEAVPQIRVYKLNR